MSRNQRGVATDWRVRLKLLLYTFVSAPGELRKIQEFSNCVDNLQAHIVSFMHDMRYTAL